MTRSSLLRSAFGAALLAAACASSPALALDAKQCLSMAEMNAALRAEGQRTMIIGDREAIYDPTGHAKDGDILRFVNTVTSNDDGSLGYQLEGDHPRAEASTKVCVRAELTNMQFFDARRPGIAKAALLGGQFDEALRADERLGTRPMVIADTVSRSADGRQHIGLPMVIVGNPAERAGFMLTRMPDGQARRMMQMADTDYTSAALTRLGTQVAMRAPN